MRRFSDSDEGRRERHQFGASAAPAPAARPAPPSECRQPGNSPNDIDVETFARMCEMIPEGERRRLRDLCVEDLASAREGLLAAGGASDRAALQRHLHVLAALGETTGAVQMGAEARLLQRALRSGASFGLPEAADRLAILVTAARDCFAALRISEDGRIG
ncbi:Hpt domain-containing protein [Roseitranquillus sediminis]|uniref:Hpt domain-containing protein n=1 Tax=Roseitranquillus sediminis TaxID=2809051 RepID=UPI001D0C25F2|nr:Hpt domain-containing protein [Roseitranquillus sediminis]MBM9594783.1 Hpt domain-containing protein [Roseitranquillus sediminis]